MIKTKNKFISILMSMLMVITILMPIIGLKASAKTINTTCTTKLIYYNSNPSPKVPMKQRTSVDITFNYNGKQYTVRGYCIHPGDSAAVDGTYPCEIVENADGTVTVTAQPFKNKKRVAPWNKIHPTAKKHTVPEWRNKPNKVQWFRGTFKPVTTGYAMLKKVTANNKHLTDGCSQYSLAGAEYGVYSDSGLKNKVGTFTTNANGESNTISLKAGTYYVKELKAPKGYKLNPNKKNIVVQEGKTATVEVSDEPMFDPLYWNIVSKTVKEGADKNLTVEGAEFTVNYYDTLDKNVEGKTPIRTWKFKADKNGFVKWDSSYLLENQPELYKDENGTVKGRIGTYTVEETKAPKGLARDEKILYIQIYQNGNSIDRQYFDNSTFNNPKPIENDTAWNQIENPQTVSIKLKKKDIEKEKAQGYGTLKDAEYSVYKLNIFTGQDDFVGKIITDENGNGEIKNLKPGIYKVRETKAPKGYLINPETQRIEAIIKEENTANFEYPIESLETPTTTEITKADITTGKELEGAEIVLLNENGEELERWISTKEPHIIKGLEAGKTYKLKETIAPKGYILSETETEFTINNDGKPQRVVMFNEPISIHTTAKDKADGDKYLKPQGKQTIIDTVAYKGLTVGKEYTIKTTLMNKRTNKPIMENGKPVVVESKFVAEKMQGTVDVEIEVDVTKLAGEKVVVFEEVYYDEHGINNTVFWSRYIS